MTKIASRLALALTYAANFKNARLLEKPRSKTNETSSRKSRLRDDTSGKLKSVANACAWLDGD